MEAKKKVKGVNKRRCMIEKVDQDKPNEHACKSYVLQERIEKKHEGIKLNLSSVGNHILNLSLPSS
ncbi:unnamed protein product [Sphenostylis stenocarpa]|uniref:Uncharacterized protein n=1 Tax=Sphenostylis stenocarpa TaxID=92480 RepID=A0AA86SX23_9FABA|nr:unnamed protein product [Sphenostylis stenocarpa]